YGKSLDKHPVLRDYWQEYLRLYEVFIFQPVGAKTLTPLYREGTLEKIADHLARLEKNRQDPKDLSENEWVYGGLKIMNILEEVRISKLTGLQTFIDGKNFSAPAFQKRYRAQGVRGIGRKFQTYEFKTPAGTVDEKSKQLLEEVLGKLGTALEEIGDRAIDQWDRAAAIADAVVHLHKSAKAET